MARTLRAILTGATLLLAAAGPARADRFAGMRYEGGLQGVRKASGTLVLEDGVLLQLGSDGSATVKLRGPAERVSASVEAIRSQQDALAAQPLAIW